MSGKMRSKYRWDSSTEEEDTCDTKYRIKLRDSNKNTQQSSVTGNGINGETRKRGRGPSKRPCLNKNALMARENRLRKKAYMEKLENKLSLYEQENQSLRNTIKKQSIDIKRLTAEVGYLRSVLNNNTSITALLRTINDGLHKLNRAKKFNGDINKGSEHMDKTEAQHKYMHSMDRKENGMNCPSINMFTNITNDHASEHNGFENNINHLEVGARKHTSNKNADTRNTPLPFLGSDHTYTISNNLESEETGNLVTSSSVSQVSDNSYPRNMIELDDLMSAKGENLSHENCVHMKNNTETIDADYEQLSSFDMDIFENLPKYDEIGNTVDSLPDVTNLMADDELLCNLDNTGICLHLNSDNVSLEFCSVCQLNSKNSSIN